MTLRPWLLVLASAFTVPACAQSPVPPAAAVPGSAFLAGNYKVEGRNVDGSAYRGLVIVQARGDGRFEFMWRIGTFHRGVGTVEGNKVTVDFGDTAPAIYEIASDGSLSGTWANGRASERLTPIGLQRT